MTKKYRLKKMLERLIIGLEDLGAIKAEFMKSWIYPTGSNKLMNVI